MTKDKNKISESISVQLSKGYLISLFLASVLLLGSGSWVVKLIMVYPSPFLQGNNRFFTLLLLGYTLGLLALLFIAQLYLLVTRIGQNLVFIPKNVHALQQIGWTIGMASLVSFVMAIVAYLPLIILTIAGIALQLMVRVIRDAFAKAIALQDQVDYTI